MIEKGSVYRHYKGNVYKVIAVAAHSETMERLVVYQDMNDCEKIWVRPYDMFCEKVIYGGKEINRFDLIK